MAYKEPRKAKNLKELEKLIVEDESNPLEKEYYYLLEEDNRRSLIKADLSAKPYQFWFYNLNGYPVPYTISKDERQLLEASGRQYMALNPLTLEKEREMKLAASLSGENIPRPNDDELVQIGRQKLAEQKRQMANWATFFSANKKEDQPAELDKTSPQIKSKI